MGNTHKLWALQLNAEDWINLRKQSPRVIMFMGHYLIVLMYHIPMLILENIGMR